MVIGIWSSVHYVHMEWKRGYDPTSYNISAIVTGSANQIIIIIISDI